MRSLLLPILIFSAAVHAAEPAPGIAIGTRQAKALGIETQAVAVSGTGLVSALPAQVVVPNEQLRIVAAPLAGLLVQIDVAPGQSVRKGQVLARMSSPALVAAGRDYLQAAQQAQLAEQAAKRDEQLFKEGIIAESRHQATQSNHRQAAVGLAARQEELRLAGVPPAALGKRGGLPSEMVVTAPIDGIVLEQSVQLGQRVEAATPLFKVGKLSPLWIEIQAPAALAAQLQAGSAASVPALGAQGKVINIGRQIGAGSQSVTVRARIDTGNEKLSPGQMVEATVGVPAGGDSAGSFRVAQSAVVRHQGRSYVFAQEGEAFRPVPVTLAGQAGDQALVNSPALTSGSRVAVKGLAALKAAWLGEQDKPAEGR